jgi:hypothetical protein
VRVCQRIEHLLIYREFHKNINMFYAQPINPLQEDCVNFSIFFNVYVRDGSEHPLMLEYP